MEVPRGVIEIVREQLREVRRVRHRRTTGDSWAVGIACSRGEKIALPFDDESVEKCLECWGADFNPRTVAELNRRAANWDGWMDDDAVDA